MLSKITEFANNNQTRLDWDEYFMSIAVLASQRSPCAKTECRLCDCQK